MIETFTAIDFETANSSRCSICQVGLVQYKEGIITNELSILVQPPDNYYWDRFTGIHGICSADTATAPSFATAWQQIEPFINNQHVVAHNGAFDFHCLGHTLEYYGIAVPTYTKHCTYRIFKDNLASLCKKYNIYLNHHNALSDAKACGELFKMHLMKIKGLPV